MLSVHISLCMCMYVCILEDMLHIYMCACVYMYILCIDIYLGVLVYTYADIYISMSDTYGIQDCYHYIVEY